MSADVTSKAIESRLSKLGAQFQSIQGTSIKFARLGDAVIEYIDQGGTGHCLSVRRCNDHHEIQSDYHAGSFCDSIKEAIRYVSFINTGRYE